MCCTSASKYITLTNFVSTINIFACIKKDNFFNLLFYKSLLFFVIRPLLTFLSFTTACFYLLELPVLSSTAYDFLNICLAACRKLSLSVYCQAAFLSKRVVVKQETGCFSFLYLNFVSSIILPCFTIVKL